MNTLTCDLTRIPYGNYEIVNSKLAPKHMKFTVTIELTISTEGVRVAVKGGVTLASLNMPLEKEKDEDA